MPCALQPGCFPRTMRSGALTFSGRSVYPCQLHTVCVGGWLCLGCSLVRRLPNQSTTRSEAESLDTSLLGQNFRSAPLHHQCTRIRGEECFTVPNHCCHLPISLSPALLQSSVYPPEEVDAYGGGLILQPNCKKTPFFG